MFEIELKAVTARIKLRMKHRCHHEDRLTVLYFLLKIQRAGLTRCSGCSFIGFVGFLHLLLLTAALQDKKRQDKIRLN